jgi:hypothetical protein
MCDVVATAVDDDDSGSAFRSRSAEGDAMPGGIVDATAVARADDIVGAVPSALRSTIVGAAPKVAIPRARAIGIADGATPATWLIRSDRLVPLPDTGVAATGNEIVDGAVGCSGMRSIGVALARGATCFCSGER